MVPRIALNSWIKCHHYQLVRDLSAIEHKKCRRSERDVKHIEQKDDIFECQIPRLVLSSLVFKQSSPFTYVMRYEISHKVHEWHQFEEQPLSQKSGLQPAIEKTEIDVCLVYTNTLFERRNKGGVG